MWLHVPLHVLSAFLFFTKGSNTTTFVLIPLIEIFQPQDRQTYSRKYSINLFKTTSGKIGNEIESGTGAARPFVVLSGTTRYMIFSPLIGQHTRFNGAHVSRIAKNLVIFCATCLMPAQATQFLSYLPPHTLPSIPTQHSPWLAVSGRSK